MITVRFCYDGVIVVCWYDYGTYDGVVVLFVNAGLQLKKLQRFLKRNVQQNLETLMVLNFVFVNMSVASVRVS